MRTHFDLRRWEGQGAVVASGLPVQATELATTDFFHLTNERPRV